MSTKTISFSHQWSICQFHSFCNPNHPWNDKICSHPFSPPNCENEIEFEILLWPKGRDDQFEDRLHVMVTASKLPVRYFGKIKWDWKMSILDGDGHKCRTIENGTYDLVLNERMGPYWYDAYLFSDLTETNGLIIENDTLTLYIEIDLFADELIFPPLDVSTISDNLVITLSDGSKKIHEILYKWKIDKISEHFDKNIKFFESEVISSPNNQKFQLRFYKKSKEEELEEYCPVGLENLNDKDLIMKWVVSFIDIGEEIRCRRERIANMRQQSDVLMHDFINLEYMMNPDNELLNMTDSITLNCELTFLC